MVAKEDGGGDGEVDEGDGDGGVADDGPQTGGVVASGVPEMVVAVVMHLRLRKRSSTDGKMQQLQPLQPQQLQHTVLPHPVSS